MEREYFDVSKQIFISFSGPLIFLNLAANVFYACLLIFPPRNAPRLKQPLKMLLGCLVWCTISYCVALALLLFVIREEKYVMMIIMLREIVIFYAQNSMTCFVWLNFYYYLQIVPAQRAVMIWVKRNIKPLTYVALLFNGTLYLFSSAIYSANMISHAMNGNQTGHQIDGLFVTHQVCVFIIKVYIFLLLCMMMVSSFSTAHYLHRHIKSATQGFSSPRIQSQMRVIITGICQGVLYFFYLTFCLYNLFVYFLASRLDFSDLIYMMISSIYISGTTVNLGIGQAVCRQRAANAWKALRALCGAAGIVTRDMKMHPSHHTSGEIPNTATDDVQKSV